MKIHRQIMPLGGWTAVSGIAINNQRVPRDDSALLLVDLLKIGIFFKLMYTIQILTINPYVPPHKWVDPH